jgi:hypothetical protein
MPLLKIGYKRLYNSPGIGLGSLDSFETTANIGSFDVRVYIGKEPKHGISAVGGPRYAVVGQKMPFSSLSFGRKDVGDVKHIELLTEIVCSKMIEADPDQVAALNSNEVSPQQSLLSTVEAQVSDFRRAIDLVAGTIGLRLHRQLVIEVLAETPLVFKADGEPVQTYHGPGVEILENLELTPSGRVSLEHLLAALGNGSSEAQDFGATALTWLLKAWGEADSFSRFMSLFIPLEVILSKVTYDATEIAEQNQIDSSIKSILETHGGGQSARMIAEFQKLRQLVHPPLTGRFEHLAKAAQIEGWEADVAAFKRFNSIRNKVLHHGQKSIELIVPVQRDMQEESRDLEDLAERYVSWVLFSGAEPYQSRHRPKRSPD